MNISSKSRNSWSLVMAISIALAALLQDTASAQEAERELPASVQRHMHSGTAAVGWIDLTALDMEALQSFRHQVFGISEPLDSQKAIAEALIKLGVKRIYWVSDLSGLTSGPRAVLVPVSSDRKEAVHDILKAVVDELAVAEMRGVTVIQDDLVLAGEPDAIEQLTSEHDGKVSSELLAAAARTSGPHGLVVATPVQTMLPVVALLPKLTNTTPQITAQAAEYLVSLKTASISGDLPPSDVTIRIRTKSEAVADGLSKLVNQWTTEQLQDKATHLQFSTSENDLVLHLDSDEKAMNALAAVQLMTTGSVDQRVFNSLRQIALAMHNFHDPYGYFPPQALVNTEGKKLLSWRVLILPYLDHADLYNEFHLNEPWDSEHNSQLIDRMPDVFRSAPSVLAGPAEPGKTRFVTPLTEQSVFGRKGPGASIKEITDGTSNTLLTVHVDDDRAVIWTKPEDVVVADDAPFDSILKADSTEFAIGMCDGSVRIISRATPVAALKSMLSLNGGEIVNWDDVK